MGHTDLESRGGEHGGEARLLRASARKAPSYYLRCGDSPRLRERRPLARLARGI